MTESDHFPFYTDPMTEMPTMDWAVDDFKRKLLRTALMRTRGNMCKAAIILGMHRNTILRLCRELEITPRDFKKKPVRSHRGEPA